MAMSGVRRLALGLTVAGLFGFSEVAHPSPILPRPIIAGIFAEPAKYLGQRVEIYGLVVGVESGRRFLLQDVSQMPMLITSPLGITVADGGQLIVKGIVKKIDGDIGIVAERLKHAKVLGGGGCCYMTESLLPSSLVDTWLWIAMVITAVLGGVLCFYGASLRDRTGDKTAPGAPGFRIIMAGYVMTSVSVLLFAIRGFL
jgi:hypothetical protein